jgi:hypothetical protein
MNFATARVEEQPIPGIGVRVDFNLTPEDAIEGVFVEVESAATASSTAPIALGGVVQVDTLTFPAFAAAVDGDYFIVTDTAGDEWAVAFDATGASAEPTGARWLAVPPAQRAQCDISAAVTAVDVAAAVELIFDALGGVTVATDDSAADGTMTFTQPDRGVVANPETFNADDTGAGTITTAATTPGVDPAVNVTAETVTLASDPGWLTGKPVTPTSTGALPAVLTGAVVYAIRVSAGVYQFASSLANALAGTELNFADRGDAGATMTFTASGSTVGYLFNSLEKETDATLTASILSTDVYDLNLAATDSFMIAQLGFDFSVKATNRIFIKPSLTFDGFTLPARFLPHMTLRIDDPTIKITSAKVTRRGVV